ncbi:MAG TPA: iron-containing alcohol dehydrogenase [bacterium]|nr:iron-containing alcohol dehydrogenase [bacterium]
MALPEYFQFQDRTKVIYGQGTLSSVGEEAKLAGGAKALIVTDKIISKLGYAETVANSLRDAGIEVVMTYDDVPQDSSATMIQTLYEDVKKLGGADICVAIGGGSVLDTTKMVNLLLSEGGDLLDDHQGAYLQEKPLNPMVAIPTTAGTGSEVTFAAVIKDTEQHQKISFISPFFAPNTAILDPDVTLSMPPGITAGTGMDALTHAIEALHSATSEPVSDALALGAIRMINEFLPVAVKDGKNVEARGQMLIASTIAGIAFTNSMVGVVHAIAHSIGGIAGVPHGLANSLMLPWCMEFNLEYCTDKYAQSAYAMGVIPTGDPAADAETGIAKVRELISKTGLPTRLRDVGVTEEQFEDIVGM